MTRYILPLLILIMMAPLGCGGSAPQPPGAPDGGSASARPGGPPPGTPPGPPPAMDPAARLERTMKTITPLLKLTPQQAEKVKAILKAGEDKKEALVPAGGRYDSPDAMTKMLAEMRRLDQETQAELAKVMSKDQMEDYMDYLEEEREALTQGRRAKRGLQKDPPPPMTGSRVGKPGGY